MIENLKSSCYFVLGGGILTLNKLRTRKYAKPRNFATQDVKKCLSYDAKTLEFWTKHLQGYLQQRNPFDGKIILELGPGPDIGIGAALLDHGAQKYYAIDANPLMYGQSPIFFKALKAQLKTEAARKEVDLFIQGASTRLNYIVDPEFNIQRVSGCGINLVVSNSAFEHFDDVQRTISEVSNVVDPGTCFFALIDMQTHTSWIRNKDPNNIYRYPSWMYRGLHYPGIPNRVRMEKYGRLLTDTGWANVQVLPSRRINQANDRHTLVGLCREFDNSDMSVLSCILLATKQRKGWTQDSSSVRGIPDRRMSSISILISEWLGAGTVYRVASSASL